jgi:hypothetical protein
VSRVDGRTQKERLEAGELYVADDPVLQDELRRAARLTKAFNDSSPDDVERRRGLLVELLGSLGDGAEIRLGGHTRPPGRRPRRRIAGARRPRASLITAVVDRAEA